MATRPERFAINGDQVTFSGLGGFTRNVPIDVLNQAVDYRVGNTQQLQNNLAGNYWTPEGQRQNYDALVRTGQNPWGSFDAYTADMQNQRQAYENSIMKHSPLLGDPNLAQLNPTLNQELANDLPGFGGFRQDYDTAQASYLKEQQGTGKFSSFLKGAAPIAALGIGAFAAPTIAGAFAPAASTGVAAGGAATGSSLGSLGSSILSGFSAPQALSGAITGGLGGLMSGGDLSSALKGAGLGGLGGGFGSSIAGGLGIDNFANQQAFTGALTGASGGLATGDLNAALIGAGLGGIGGYAKAGGEIPFLGSVQQSLPGDVFGPPKPGTGLIGDLTGAANTGLTIGGQPMRLGSLLSAGGDIYGYMQGREDLKDIENIYRQQARRAEAQFNPYAEAGQQALGNLMGDPSTMLQNDPGYQFRLQQGQQALERSLAAQGLGQSGAALKAAQEYGQGLADQTYQDFFNRQNMIANRGFNAAQGLGNVYTGLGDAQAMARAQQANLRNQTLGSLLGGGYDAQGNILEGSLSRLLGGLF